MSAPRATYIHDIADEHVEELGFLWGQRRAALRSSGYTIRALADLEERIAAHLQGVLAVGDHALPLLEDTLAQDDPLAVFAAAFALLHSDSVAARSRVLEAFMQAQGERLGGLRDALCHAPLHDAAPQLDALSRSSAAPVAIAAGEALAFHGTLQASREDVQRFLRHDDAMVREHAWHLVGYLGASVDPKQYAAAMREQAGPARAAALHAGAWCREPGILAACRKLASDAPEASPDALALLAVLGVPQDLDRFRALGRSRELGPSRFRLLGAFGQPALMDTILAGVADPDPATAVAAAAAFTKMTGEGVDSDRRATLAPENGAEPDEFETEFRDEVTLPDPELARRVWERVKPWVRAGRLCCGVDVSAQLTPEAFAALDMESRWEVCLRARYSGAWSGTPVRLERFPQARP